ncbi:MAG: glycosyltransferase [Bacteroides sp.]|nr:glycosyltransferase [Bacteroides sp.]
MKPLLSIIIPVYNVEKYLIQILENLTHQSGLEKCEIICINDGSTDASLEILNTYRLRIANFFIISKKNEGVSVARNVGIDKASGKYVSFIDADDLIHPGAIQVILKYLEEYDPDILSWKYRPFYSNPKYSELLDIKVTEIKNDNLQAFDIMVSKGIAVGIYLKAVRKDIFYNPSIQFDTTMSYGEDMFVSWKCISKAKTIILIDTPLYFYRQSSNSAITRFHKNLYEKYGSAIEDMKLFIKTIGKESEEYTERIDYHLAMRLPSLTMMEYRAPYSNEEKKMRLKMILNDPRIKRALATATLPSSKIFKLAIKGDIEGMLKMAKFNSKIATLLNPLKRILK